LRGDFLQRIILTGGGTAGHVTPNLALVPWLTELGYEIFYIGGKNGIEKTLSEKAGVPFTGISSGKLRRYFHIKNLTDVFRVIKGIGDAMLAVRRIRPAVVFSKGGFVTVPVVIAAKLQKAKVILHESDMTPGLANKLSLPFADKVCVCFPETARHVPRGKAVLTGTPIRRELYDGVKEKAAEICRFSENKPVILVMGGSQGSVKINEALRAILPKLLKHFNVIHLCGKGHRRAELTDAGYAQFEYVSAELPHLLAYADLIVSRAGANSISEFLALKKPNLLIPLSRAASRGDQILNAASYAKQGFSMVLQEENLTETVLYDLIQELYRKKQSFRRTMFASTQADGTRDVIKVIREMT
jgi:UDP-N-acetylglucosamine--N-acetylmuramyl-(pentapeptide) pyrophosphoryl-undecaprenol N-acetylglucosamine transferase